MLCTAQLGRPVVEAFGRVQYTPFQLADKSPMITDQHTAGGSVSQLSQLAKLSPWLTLSTKDISTSFWHYNKWFCSLSNQIMGLYNFSNQNKIKSVHLWWKIVHLWWKINVDYLRYRMKKELTCWARLTYLNCTQPCPISKGEFVNEKSPRDWSRHGRTTCDIGLEHDGI